jgi:hypothetical protein
MLISDTFLIPSLCFLSFCSGILVAAPIFAYYNKNQKLQMTQIEYSSSSGEDGNSEKENNEEGNSESEDKNSGEETSGEEHSSDEQSGEETREEGKSGVNSDDSDMNLSNSEDEQSKYEEYEQATPDSDYEDLLELIERHKIKGKTNIKNYGDLLDMIQNIKKEGSMIETNKEEEPQL